MYYILASVALREQQPDEAFAFYRHGIEAADTSRAANADHLVMIGLNRLALALLSAGRLDAAERAVLEVYRYRVLHNDPDVVYCYPILAEIEMRRGHLDQAKRLSQRGVDTATADPRGLPLHEFQRIHALVLQQRAEYQDAHAAFLAALNTARRWRLDLLPADASRNAGETSLASLYDAALQNAAHLYFDRQQRPAKEKGVNKIEMAAEAWLQAEDWRAASLRRFIADGREWLTQVGGEYWEVLAEFRRLDAASLRHPSKEGTRKLELLQVRLAELESFAGANHIIATASENFPSGKALSLYRRSLQRAQTLISFQLGAQVSHRWTLSSSGLTWTRLPPRAEIADLSVRFRNAVENGSSAAEKLGSELGNLLLGDLNADAESARSWVLVLDDGLFQVPFAALRKRGRGGGGVDRFLVEQYALTSVPGAWSLLGKPVADWNGDFVGVADAVYNSADPRWAHAASDGSIRPVSAAARLRLIDQSSTDSRLSQLPRLAASRQEVYNSARAWNAVQSPVMLMGMDASLRGLTGALEHHPSVVHFAAHVIPNPSSLDRAYIALSLAPDAAPELLSTSDVGHLKLHDPLVVLSGCHSAIGTALRGSGLIGMVRAWLLSGAAAVVASLWPIPDDRGVIFESFYRELRKEVGLGGHTPVQSAAEALRRAQLEMLRSNSWRAQPKFWATYLITGRTR